MAKKAAEKALNLDNILFNCRDILRAARNSGSFFEKRDMMLTLVFLRFIGEKYEDGVEKLRQTLVEQGLDPDDENIRAAFSTTLLLRAAFTLCRRRPDGPPLSTPLRRS